MRRGWFLLYAFVWLNACTTTTVTPSRSSRQIIDSVYQQKIISLQPQMDSICAGEHNTVFRLAADSILAVRKMEMDSLVK